jgi:hypothetical protein
MFSISYMGVSGPTLDPWICSSSESEPSKVHGRPPSHKDAIVQSDALLYYNTAQLYCTLQLNFFTTNSLFLSPTSYPVSILQQATHHVSIIRRHARSTSSIRRLCRLCCYRREERDQGPPQNYLCSFSSVEAAMRRRSRGRHQRAV